MVNFAISSNLNKNVTPFQLVFVTKYSHLLDDFIKKSQNYEDFERKEVNTVRDFNQFRLH